MNGSQCLKVLLSLIEKGNMYMNEASPESHPSTPLFEASNTVRSILALVGFSRKTTDVGKENLESNNEILGQTDLANALSDFRSKIRKYSINSIQSKESQEDFPRTLLEECDKLRNEMAAKGLELLDHKVADEVESRWRWCIPKDDTSANTDTTSK